jgi:hypothetical protein
MGDGETLFVTSGRSGAAAAKHSQAAIWFFPVAKNEAKTKTGRTAPRFRICRIELLLDS